MPCSNRHVVELVDIGQIAVNRCDSQVVTGPHVAGRQNLRTYHQGLDHFVAGYVVLPELVCIYAYDDASNVSAERRRRLGTRHGGEHGSDSDIGEVLKIFYGP